MKKLSTFALVVIFIATVFAVGIVATACYYYVIPHPTYLRILHNQPDQMANKVINNFTTWYHQKYGRQIEVALTQTDPQTAYEKATIPPRKPQAEIWWGGPLSLFEKAIGALLAYNATPFLNNEINKTCHSCPLVDLSQNTPRWYAASLYGLGIMYNEHRLNMLNLTKPQSWADLTLDEYEGNITMVDPATSELTSSFIMLILESKNWTKGWEYLVNMSALITHYEINEDNSVWKVASDYLPLAVVPDFYAYDQMAVSTPYVNFIYLDATILQPEPIAIFKRGTYLSEAKAFIDYILTTQAQNIIGKYRLPMHQDATEFPSKYNPFDPNFPHVKNYNQTSQEIIKDYYQAWITERYDVIKTAWKEIKGANKTKETNWNATYYYNLAWNNFTYVGYYINRSEIDIIYDKTDGWTTKEDIELYKDEWQNASIKAYNNAIENAKNSKQAAQTSNPL